MTVITSEGWAFLAERLGITETPVAEPGSTRSWTARRDATDLHRYQVFATGGGMGPAGYLEIHFCEYCPRASLTWRIRVLDHRNERITCTGSFGYALNMLRIAADASSEA